ncbi:MAG TPA: alpha/beta fold hydrolase [Solirubrobacteraceae bacterium]|nr:alpha/beta fold hydrolase [Solirubrobacteraceae bacterium]
MTVTPTAPPRRAGEQTRARYPDEEGFVERDGVRVFWESYGAGEQTILFLPTWTLVHSRVWKAQIPYFARHFRVVTFDPRGNGRSDRPRTAEAYDESEFAKDALDVLDACGVDRAVCVSLSRGAQRALLLATEHPERVSALAFVGPMFPVTLSSLSTRLATHPRMLRLSEQRSLTTRGVGKFNLHYWQHGGYADFVRWWAERMLPEPHSTKQTEDAIAWSHDTDGATLALSFAGRLAAPATRRAQSALAERVRCRCSSSTAPRTRSPRTPTARRSRRSPAGGWRRCRTRGTCRTRASRCR